jgi:hypothetical protein
MDLLCDFLENDREVIELLIEMTGQQQHRVLELALVAVYCPLAKITDHDGRTDGDCGNQKCAAGDEPSNRCA